MTIPTVGGEHGLLPDGRHRATLEEIEAYFVTAAPFSTERELVFQAFKTWFNLVDRLLPNSRYWVNGGFVTHKAWGAPSDVDVMILCKPDVIDALTPEQQVQLEQLLTSHESGQGRFQPMGGLVDAFLCPRGVEGKASYWMAQWSKVKGPDGDQVLALTKGFLEVVT